MGETLGRKGVKWLLLVGHENVPRGVGLTGNHVAPQLVVLGTEGGLPAEHKLLGRSRGYLSHFYFFS